MKNLHASSLFALPLVLLFALASFTDEETAEARLDAQFGSSLVLSIDVDSGITPFMADYILSAINAASAKKATALLINLDTPGGLYETTREIVQNMLASPVPIIVYVSPQGARAGSAGVFIALAANVVAMAPSTNIGAAHPVDASGGDVEGDMKEKITNDAKAWARSIAETRGKNADWAEKAVVGSEAISALKAAELGVIDFVASDLADLLAKADGKVISQGDKQHVLHTKSAEIVPFPMSLQQEVMKFLANPNLLYILLLLGILGVIIEFQSPGLILPGLFGVICLAVVFGVQILPINWFGALLIFAAAALFIAEIFITSFGLLGIGGLILLVVGSYLLFSVEGSTFFVEPLIIWLFSGGFAVIIAGIGLVLYKSRRHKPLSNVFALVGAEARVTEAIHPPASGVVVLQGSFWRAQAKVPVEKDEYVVVTQVLGTTVFVELKARN